MAVYNFLLTGLLILTTIALHAQESKNSVVEEIQVIAIQTSAQCGQCKERIEKNMAFEKGVKQVDLDLETRILTVKYKPSKTDPEKLRKALSKLGYDADEVAADPDAYEKLPACCKKGGHG